MKPTMQTASHLGRRSFWVVALVLSLLIVADGSVPRVVGAAPSDTITLTSPANTTVAESDDYATQVLSRPWDMSTDDQFAFLEYVTPPTVSDGIWSTTTSQVGGAGLHLIDAGFSRVNNYIGQRVGGNYPIDTHRFTHLRFRMYTDVANQGVIYWFNAASEHGNSVIFTTYAGWHIYDIDLTQTGGAANPPLWTSSNWVGMRLDPQMTVNRTGVNIKFDWVRLTPATGPTVSINWQSSGRNPIDLYLDSDTNPNNGTEYQIASGLSSTANSYNWTANGLAPGTYYVRAVMGDASSYSSALVINDAPVLNITAPSPSSGEDYAQTRLDSSWRMTSLSQIEFWDHLTNITFGPDYLQAGSNAVAGGHADPEVWFLKSDRNHTIDTSIYHYVTYQMYIQAPNYSVKGQYPQVNLGPRVIWSQPDVDAQQDEAYMHYYNRWEHVALDLRTVMLAPGYNSTGWTGQVFTFRIDPYEEDGAFGSNVLPEFFRLGNVRLTADPTVANGGATTISWTPLKSQGTVTLKYSTNQNGGGTTFATVPLGQGGYVWKSVNLPAGSYWITAVADDGFNTFTQVARAPLVVTSKQACPPNFSDVSSTNDAAFYQYIVDLACRNIVDGYKDNTFQPYSNATRAQLAKWVVLSRGWDLDTTGGPHFTDVPTTDPYYPYIETALLHNVLGGYAASDCLNNDGPCFKPDNSLTRGQMSKMIVNAMGWPTNASTQRFSDVPTDYTFYPYIEALVAHGAVGGYSDGTFKPGNSLTRSQLAKVLSISVNQ